MRSTAALMLVVFGIYSTGCSLIFTKGPQPEVQPPPQCTTSNVAPALDTTAALLFAGGAITSFYVAATPCEGWPVPNIPCSNQGEAGTYWALGAGAVALAALFTASAVVGFNRTAACTSSPGFEPHQPASSPLPQSSFLLVPQGGCPTPGDAPRSCSAVVLDEARVTVLH